MPTVDECARHPVLAGLLAALDSGERPGSDRRALKQAWREGDVLSVRGRIDALFDHPPKVARTLFARRPDWLDDPRVVDGLLEGLRTLPGAYGGPAGLAFWGDAIRFLITLGDPRVAPALAALDLGDRSPVGNLVRQLRPGPLASVSPPDDPPDLAELAAWTRSARRPRGPDLLAAVYAHPEDDAPKAVYADHLVEAGDPRGEAILLGLRGRSTSRLDREHGARWLDGLGPAVSRAWCRGGFVESVVLRRGADLLIGHPAWAFVRRVDLVGRTDAGALLATLPALEAVRGARSLDGLPRSLRRLEAELDAPDVASLLSDRGWSLEEVVFRNLAVPPAGPLLERLTSLGFRGESPPLRELQALPGVAVVRVEQPAWVLELRRGDSGFDRVVCAAGPRGRTTFVPSLVRVLGALDLSRLQTVEVELPVRWEVAETVLERALDGVQELAPDLRIVVRRGTSRGSPQARARRPDSMDSGR